MSATWVRRRRSTGAVALVVSFAWALPAVADTLLAPAWDDASTVATCSGLVQPLVDCPVLEASADAASGNLHLASRALPPAVVNFASDTDANTDATFHATHDLPGPVEGMLYVLTLQLGTARVSTTEGEFPLVGTQQAKADVILTASQPSSATSSNSRQILSDFNLPARDGETLRVAVLLARTDGKSLIQGVPITITALVRGRLSVFGDGEATLDLDATVTLEAVFPSAHRALDLGIPIITPGCASLIAETTCEATAGEGPSSSLEATVRSPVTPYNVVPAEGTAEVGTWSLARNDLAGARAALYRITVQMEGASVGTALTVPEDVNVTGTYSTASVSLESYPYGWTAASCPGCSSRTDGWTLLETDAPMRGDPLSSLPTEKTHGRSTEVFAPWLLDVTGEPFPDLNFRIGFRIVANAAQDAFGTTTATASSSTASGTVILFD